VLAPLSICSANGKAVSVWQNSMSSDEEHKTLNFVTYQLSYASQNNINCRRKQFLNKKKILHRFKSGRSEEKNT